MESISEQACIRMAHQAETILPTLVDFYPIASAM